MNKLEREDIHIISRYSNLTEVDMNKALKEQVYNDKSAWQKFLQLFMLSLGIGFTIAGIIFFFAYNWAELSKFTKIGLIEGLLILTTVLALFFKIDIYLKKIILTGSAVLVGVLFAVFGQIYQTGANAYDLFLFWTLFISLWVFVVNFPALWLVYIILINLTLILYGEQVANDWPVLLIFCFLFILNAVALIIATYLSTYKKSIHFPNWFLNVLGLAVVSYGTIGIITGIFERDQAYFWMLIAEFLFVYGLGIGYGIKTRSIFYLSVIPFSIIIIISALLIKISDGEFMFLLVALWLIISVIFVIKYLVHLQKKFVHEQ